jgi:hypothetical protein
VGCFHGITIRKRVQKTPTTYSITTALDKAIEIAPGWDLPRYNKSILQNPELKERALIWKNSQKRDVISDPRPNWGGKKYILDVQPG